MEDSNAPICHVSQFSKSLIFVAFHMTNEQRVRPPPTLRAVFQLSNCVGSSWTAYARNTLKDTRVVRCDSMYRVES